MPDLNTLMLFSAAALALTLTPGPDMLLIASRSAAQGRAAGFATWAGIAAGTYMHAIAAALGLSQLFLMAPVAYDVVRYSGAAYLLYLAWSTFRGIQAVDTVNPTEPPRHTFTKMFLQGFLTNILNPKMALFVLALFPQFVVLEAGSVALQIMVLATVINVLGFVVNGVVILLANRATVAFTGQSKIKQWLHTLLAGVFFALAFRLVFDSGQE